MAWLGTFVCQEYAPTGSTRYGSAQRFGTDLRYRRPSRPQRTSWRSSTRRRHVSGACASGGSGASSVSGNRSVAACEAGRVMTAPQSAWPAGHARPTPQRAPSGRRRQRRAALRRATDDPGPTDDPRATDPTNLQTRTPTHTLREPASPRLQPTTKPRTRHRHTCRFRKRNPAGALPGVICARSRGSIVPKQRRRRSDATEPVRPSLRSSSGQLPHDSRPGQPTRRASLPPQPSRMAISAAGAT